jgi:hypothetical protein
MLIILCKQFLDGFYQIRLQRVFIIAARAMNTVTTAGTAAAPLFTLFFVKLMPAESAFHARIPVTRRNLLSR